MSATGFDVYTAHYVGRRIVRPLLLQEEGHFAEKKEAGTQATVSGNDIPASWKYGTEREKSPKVRVQWQRL